MTQLAIEVGHWSAIVPLALLVAFRRQAPAAFWLVALAFACSFVADSIAALTGGSWSASPHYMVVQYALFAVALFTDGARWVVPSVALYAVLGTALYFGMVRYATPEQYDAFMRWWYPYQATRLASFGLFVRAAWRA